LNTKSSWDSLDHCVVCSSSIYDFWLHLWGKITETHNLKYSFICFCHLWNKMKINLVSWNIGWGVVGRRVPSHRNISRAGYIKTTSRVAHFFHHLFGNSLLLEVYFHFISEMTKANKRIFQVMSFCNFPLNQTIPYWE
jgi:hypothetical protein